jgi:PilZ domain
MDDRRSKPRLSVNLDAVWDRKQARQSACVIDLSEGGCYLDTVGAVRVGEIAAFRIMFPDGDWLYLEGEVRHHRHELGFGVQFVDLNEEQLGKLRLLLEMAKDGPKAQISADLVDE